MDAMPCPLLTRSYMEAIFPRKKKPAAPTKTISRKSETIIQSLLRLPAIAFSNPHFAHIDAPLTSSFPHF